MSPTREELLKLLEVMSRVWPDMRLGQWMVALSFWATGKTDYMYDVEDEDLIRAIRRHLEHRGVDLNDVDSAVANFANGAAVHEAPEIPTP